MAENVPVVASATKKNPNFPFIRPTPKRHCCVFQPESVKSTQPTVYRSAASAARATFKQKTLRGRKSGSLPDLTAIKDVFVKDHGETPKVADRTPLQTKHSNALLKRVGSIRQNSPIISELRRKQRECEKSLKELREKYREERDKCDDYDVQVRQLKEERDEYQKKTADLNASVTRLREQLYNTVELSVHEELMDRENKLAKANDNLKLANNAVEKKNEDLLSELADTSKQLRETKVELQSAATFSHQRVAEMTSIIEGLKEGLENKQSELNIVNQESERIFAEAGRMKLMFEDSLDETNHLKTEIENLKSAKTSLEKKNQELIRGLSESKDLQESAFSLSAQRIAELTNLNASLKGDFEIKQSELNTEKREKERLFAEAGQMKLILEDNVEKANQLNTENENLKSVKITVEKKNDELLNELANTSKQLNDTKIQMQSVLSLSAERMAELTNLTANLREDIVAKQSQLEFAEQEKDRLVVEAKQLRIMLQDDNVRLESTVSVLNKEIENLRVALTTLGKSNEELMVELSESKVQMKSVVTLSDQRVGEMTKLNEGLKKDLENKQSELNTVKQEKECIFAEAGRMKLMLEDCLDETNHLKTEIANLKSAKTAVDKKNEELILELSENKVLQESAFVLSEERIAEMTNLAANLKEHLQDKESEVDMLKQEKDLIVAEAVQIKSILEVRLDEAKQLKTEIENLESAKNAFEKKNEELLNELSENKVLQESAFALSEERIAEMTNLTANLKEHLQDKESELDLLKQEKDLIVAEAGQIKSILEVRLDEAKQLKTEIENLESVKNAFEKKNEELLNELADTSMQLHETKIQLQSSVSLSAERMAELTNLTANLREDIVAKQSQLEFVEQEKDRLVVEAEQLKIVLNSVEVTKSHLQEDNNRLQSTISLLNKEIENLNSGKTTVEEKNEQLLLEVSESKVQRESAFALSAQRIAELTNLNASLKEDFENKQSELNTEKREKERLFAEAGQMKVMLSETLDTNSQLLKEIAMKKDHLSELKNLVSALKEENYHLSSVKNVSVDQEDTIERLKQQLKLMEESFEIERFHKSRYLRDLTLLEKKMQELQQQGAKPSSTTFIFPTTINVNKGEEQSAASIVHSLSQSFMKDKDVDMSISSNQSFRPPEGTGRSCFMNDEPVELVNRSTLSNAARDSFMAEEDGIHRLSMLQRRNQQMPPHLRSSYAAEFPNIQVSEKDMKFTANDVLVDIGNQNRTFSLTETREVRTTKTFTDTYVKGPARITPKRSIFRRVKKWTPERMDSGKTSELP